MENDDLLNLASIWQLYGFVANPFTTSPLLVKGGILPLSSFTGRTKELKLLLKLLAAEGGGRTFVSGDIGVGKTTLVNYARAILLEKGFFTPLDEIGIKNNLDANSFILDTLASIYDTIVKQVRKPILDDSFKKLQALVGVGDRRTNSVGMNAFGIGGNLSSETIDSLQISTHYLESFFKELILEISSHTTGKDVIIHYNNLERLKERYIRDLFEDLRDFFQTPHVQFVFVGNSVVWNLLQGMKRVSSILSITPIIVKNLAYQEVEELLRKRFNGMKIHEKNTGYLIPYDTEVLKTLYELYEGNVRYILNSLNTAIIRATDNRPIVLNNYLLAKTLNRTVSEEYLINSKIAPRAKEILMKILESDEITNKGLSDALKILRPNVSTYLSELVDAGCIELKRQNGRDKYWTVLPHIKWLKLKASEKEKGKQTYLQPHFTS